MSLSLVEERENTSLLTNFAQIQVSMVKIIHFMMHKYMKKDLLERKMDVGERVYWNKKEIMNV